MMNRRFVRILGLLVLLTQNLNIIETTDINGEGRQKDVNVTHLETVKDEKPNSSNVSAFPVANNDTLVSGFFLNVLNIPCDVKLSFINFNFAVSSAITHLGMSLILPCQAKVQLKKSITIPSQYS